MERQTTLGLLLECSETSPILNNWCTNHPAHPYPMATTKQCTRPTPDLLEDADEHTDYLCISQITLGLL